MKKIILLIGIILIQHTGIIFAQEPYITDFYNNKDGAISISFDDGTYGQYEYAFSTLNKFNFKATFGIVGEWTDDTCGIYSEDGTIFHKRLSKRNVYRIWAKGNEIAWHGLKHIEYNNKLSWNILHKQMSSEKTYARMLLLPIKITTMLYPYSKTKGKVRLATESSGFLFGRTAGDKYNDINNIDYYLLNSFAIYNNNNPNTADFNKIIDGAKGKWCILMYHHIIPDTSKQTIIYKKNNIINSYAISPQSFDYQILLISYKNYWVGTIYDVGRYLMQRERSDLYIEYEGNNTYITIICDLDKEIYNHEMTVIYNDKLYNIKPNVRTKI